MESLLEVYQQLKVQGYTLDAYRSKDENQLYEIFRQVVDAGGQFPYETNSLQEFHRQFLGPESHVYVCHCSTTQEVIGGFYIRPNYTDSLGRVANAAYMLRDIYRGRGIGTLLIKASLYLTKSLGFHALQYNKVFSQNTVAIQLYQKLGFNIVKTFPNEEAHILLRKLDDINLDNPL